MFFFVCFSGPCLASPLNSNGFYTEISSGITNIHDNFKLAFYDGKVLNNSNYNFSDEISKKNYANMDISLGYGNKLGPFYLAGKIEVDLNRRSTELKTNDFSYKSKQNNVFMPQLLLGYSPGQKVMVYGSFGFAWTTFHKKIDFISGGIYNTSGMLLNNVDETISSYGPKAAVGIKYNIWRDLQVKLEFSHVSYRSGSIGLNDRTYNYSGFNPIGKYKFDTTTNEVSVGLNMPL
jgi:opacity protein-like surface antigen